MKTRLHLGCKAGALGCKAGAALGLVLVYGSAWGQYQPPPPPLTTAPCVPTKKESCITSQPAPAPAVDKDKKTDAFPFPGDEKAAPADSKGAAFPFPVDVPAASAPAKVGDPPTGGGAYPFPQDDSGASSSSSSSSSGGGSATDDADSDDLPKLTDKGSEGSTKASQRKLVKVESMADREAEDLTVSKYYVSTGNFKGAYLRAQDAVKSMPDDPEAHFALALAARKLKQKDEAVTEYKVYLRMEPKGEHAKAAARALEELR